MSKFNYDDMPCEKKTSTGETVPTTSGFYGPRYIALQYGVRRMLYGDYSLEEWEENLRDSVARNERQKEERLKRQQEEGPQLKKTIKKPFDQD